MSVVPLPAMTGTIYAINWLFVPVIFLVMVGGSRFWDEANARKFAKGIKTIGIWKHAGAMLFLSISILGDLGLAPAIGYFSMAEYATAMKHNWFASAHHHPVGIALFYWGFGLYEALVYGYFIAVIGGVLLHWMRKARVIPHSP